MSYFPNNQSYSACGHYTIKNCPIKEKDIYDPNNEDFSHEDYLYEQWVLNGSPPDSNEVIEVEPLKVENGLDLGITKNQVQGILGFLILIPFTFVYIKHCFFENNY